MLSGAVREPKEVRGMGSLGMDNGSVLERIRQADMVLAGLGEDFDCLRILKQDAAYVQGRAVLEQEGALWLLPAWNDFCLEKRGGGGAEAALGKLAGILADKNYFVVSVSTGCVIRRIPWKGGRLVEPCGGAHKKQCSKGCGEPPAEVEDADRRGILTYFDGLYSGLPPREPVPGCGKCMKCGASLTLNNIYSDNYDENGYLDQWRFYMKWLQGTLNRSLFILELGVGMGFPSVVRWPFEKIAFLNQKSFFCRVHERLYQLDEKLTGKGCGISQNAIDWLGRL